ARVCLAGLALTSCASPVTSLPTPPATAPTPEAERRFDDLELTLQLDSPTVETGREVQGTLVISNHSGEAVVDPGCWLSAPSSAIVPPDAPDAELWLQTVVDCSGPGTIPDGSTARHRGLTFAARTKYGEPLPAGDYVAAVEYRGLSRRLEAAVHVTD
ncbi:MAG: hypothetical protein M3271_03835, partial [Actinomycetota bacterium]|nr:hypothetical protein [Actinomycetota bacterium]